MAKEQKDDRPVVGDESQGTVTGATYNEQPGPQKGGQDGVNERLMRAGIPVAEVDPAPVAKADRSSDAGPYDHDLDMPPLRSPRAEAELSVALGQGAGLHVPPDPEKYDAQGRPKG